MSDADLSTRVAEAFLSFRAENYSEDLFKLFTEPNYFPQLKTPHACLLVGGRGTGKTTTLMSLSYRGMAALAGKDLEAPHDLAHVGIYYRVDTNRVRAFTGSELSEDRWARMFAHFLNLELCGAILDFLDWSLERWPTLNADDLDLDPFATALHLPLGVDLSQTSRDLELSLLSFEGYVNNVAGEEKPPPLSMQGAPVAALLAAIRKLPPFRDKLFMVLVDEYENLLDYQQRVFNTLVKHSQEGLTYKVGVRELGFRQRTTLNPDELLAHPADYHRIDIVEELRPRFAGFAADVCNGRLRLAANGDPPLEVAAIFPELPIDQEAQLLGVADIAAGLRHDLEEVPTTTSMSDFELFALSCRAKSKNQTLAEALTEASANPERWAGHLKNYRYSYLFALRPRKRGIRKYYAGWDVLCLLSGGNIRYLLELIQRAFTLHRRQDRPVDEPVSAQSQTRAAQLTGRKHLQELEGLSIHGATLTHLLLSIGRIFQVMAEDPVGHAPEVTQFFMEFDNGDQSDAALHDNVKELLDSAIVHQAIVRYDRTKLQGRSDIRDYDYSLHPIFSAFFGFGHRRKRSMKLTPAQLWSLIREPGVTIPVILDRQNRDTRVELPEQLRLFEDFYARAD